MHSNLCHSPAGSQSFCNNIGWQSQSSGKQEKHSEELKTSSTHSGFICANLSTFNRHAWGEKCHHFLFHLFLFFPLFIYFFSILSALLREVFLTMGKNKQQTMWDANREGGGGSDEPFSQPTWAQYFVQCNTFCRNSWKEFTSFFHASFLKVLTRSGIAIDEGNSAYHVTELGQWAHGDHDLPRSKVSRAAAAEEQRFLPHGLTHVLRLCVGTRQVCPCEGEGCLRRVQERSCCTRGSLV